MKIIVCLIFCLTTVCNGAPARNGHDVNALIRQLQQLSALKFAENKDILDDWTMTQPDENEVKADTIQELHNLRKEMHQKKKNFQMYLYNWAKQYLDRKKYFDEEMDVAQGKYLSKLRSLGEIVHVRKARGLIMGRSSK